jgi:hypothetical protein
MKQLAIYLNDHLAGSIAGIELIDDLRKRHTDNPPLAKFLEALRVDIVADQAALQKLVQRLGKESTVRKVGGWLAERIGQMKFKAARRKNASLGLMEGLEALVLGITGKQLLWRAINASLGSSPLLRDVDLSQLEERAIEQLERVESYRLDAARDIFLRGK